MEVPLLLSLNCLLYPPTCSTHPHILHPHPHAPSTPTFSTHPHTLHPLAASEVSLSSSTQSTSNVSSPINLMLGQVISTHTQTHTHRRTHTHKHHTHEAPTSNIGCTSHVTTNTIYYSMFNYKKELPAVKVTTLKISTCFLMRHPMRHFYCPMGQLTL